MTDIRKATTEDIKLINELACDQRTDRLHDGVDVFA